MKLAIGELRAVGKKERDSENLMNLVESIKEIGLIEPIVLNERNEIISGRRRYLAAKEIGISKVDVVYCARNSIDQELAQIDSNLMILPLGDVDHDQALARRKKLYEQKYPTTRQYAPGPREHRSFTADISDTLGITSRSVELAVSRAEKASPSVTTARREGKLSSTVVNALVRLPTSYQDKLLPMIEKSSVAEVKKYVEIALEKDADFALAHINKRVTNFIEPLEKSMDKLTHSLATAFDHRVKLGNDARPLVEKASEIISLLEKFIEVYTPTHKPILRKQTSLAS